jgi:DNA repair protein RecO
LASLRSARMSRPFLHVLQRLEAMQVAGRAMEVLRDSLPERVAEPEIFDESVTLLEHLDRGVTEGPVLLLLFEVRVLALSGFALRLDHCGACGRMARPGQEASFDPLGGHLKCRACGGATHRLSATTRAKLNAAMEHGLSDVQWSAEALREAQLAVGAFIAHRFEGRAPQA